MEADRRGYQQGYGGQGQGGQGRRGHDEHGRMQSGVGGH